jgi:hypothetical protein
MTEVIVGIKQLLFPLERNGIKYVKTDPGIADPTIYGTIKTEKAIMTFRRAK